MSVLIKGMKMPKNCDECRIMMFEDTNCAPELYCGCPIVFYAHPQGIDHRPDYCPLAPVPEHGRLIDADALLMRINHEVMEAYMDGVCYGVHPSQEYLYLLGEIIDDAPTIIPAEGNLQSDSVNANNSEVIANNNADEGKT